MTVEASLNDMEMDHGAHLLSPNGLNASLKMVRGRGTGPDRTNLMRRRKEGGAYDSHEVTSSRPATWSEVGVGQRCNHDSNQFFKNSINIDPVLGRDLHGLAEALSRQLFALLLGDHPFCG